MNAADYFHLHRASAARYDDPRSEFPASTGSPSLETCLVKLRRSGHTFIGQLYVFEDGMTAKIVDNAMVNEMMKLVNCTE